MWLMEGSFLGKDVYSEHCWVQSTLGGKEARNHVLEISFY